MRLSRMVPLLILVTLACKPKQVRNLVSGFDPAIRGTVLTIVAADGSSAVYAIDETKTSENPPRHVLRHEFTDSGIEVGCQYVGRAVGHNTSIVDVYLISLRLGNKAEEYVPVVYSGGEAVVVDRPEIRVSFSRGMALPRGQIRSKASRYRSRN